MTGTLRVDGPIEREAAGKEGRRGDSTERVGEEVRRCMRVRSRSDTAPNRGRSLGVLASALGIDLGDGHEAVRLVRRGARLVVTWASVPAVRAGPRMERSGRTAGLDPRAAETLRASWRGGSRRARSGHRRVAVRRGRSIAWCWCRRRRCALPRSPPTRRTVAARPDEDYVVRTRVLRRAGDKARVPCMLYRARRFRDAFVRNSRAGPRVRNLVPSPSGLAQFESTPGPRRHNARRVDRCARRDRLSAIDGVRVRTLPLGVGLSSSLRDEAQRTDAASASSSVSRPRSARGLRSSSARPPDPRRRRDPAR